ncbi:class I adenylate-forming enzyme family protein, partial [Georgenia sp. 10Sc9-8]|nr:class I adenylate-forming enzyme family protein [Georgenia halotolerans]
MIDKHGVWTWRDLSEAVNGVAGLLSGWIDRPYGRVLFLAEDSAWHHVTLLACGDAGYIFVPLNAKYLPQDVERASEQIAPSLILVEPEHAEKARLLDMERVGEVGPLTAYVPRGGAGAPTSGEAPVLRRRPFLITLTSGSTGRPKPVLYSTEGELACMEMFSSLWRLNHNDVVLAPLPLAWIYGLSTSYLSALYAGSRSVIVPRFSPRLILAYLERSEVTMTLGVSTQYRILAEVFESHGRDPFGGRLRMAVAGGERRNEAALGRFSELTGAPVFDLYASSEWRPGFGYDPLVHVAPVVGSCGPLIAGVEVELRAGDGTAAQGEGELFGRSPGNFMGYFTPEGIVAEEVLPENWLPIGDGFRLAEDGFGFVLDRHSGTIVRGGENISPAEVEDAINSHPDVVESVVVGLPDPEYGEAVAAVVVLRTGREGDPAGLAEHVA